MTDAPAVVERIAVVTAGVAGMEEVDAAIAHGPGLRWALLGPFANLRLSGGAVENSGGAHQCGGVHQRGGLEGRGLGGAGGHRCPPRRT